MLTQLKYLLLFVFCTGQVVAQQSNGKVNSLLAAENYFSSMVKQKGIKKAFLLVSDQHTIVYRPNPIGAIDFFKRSADNSPNNLSWQPDFARVAKSGDWGFSTGSYLLKGNDTLASRYGQYLSVWKTDEDGIWKLALDLGVPHGKPLVETDLDFKDVANPRYFRQRSDKRLAQRKDVVLVTDRLLNTTLNSKGNKAYQEFLSANVRLLIPEQLPIIGKDRVMKYWAKYPQKGIYETLEADRAYSGEWAYTQGRAILSSGQSSKAYHYVRIWELQEGYAWNLVLEIFTPAGQ
ncbi:MAG: nuclear transport factor 2 family protein [Sphingobacteriaceae bacterium]